MSSEDQSMNVDSEDDWEEVEVPEHQQHLEITLDIGKPKKNDKANKKRGISHAERVARIDCHKIHTIFLISNAKVRNKWTNDPLLQARLLSLTPLHLQNAFTGIHKSRVPDQNQRGRMFERAMEQLTNWWANTFFEVVPEGHIRNHTYEEIQQKLEIRGLHLPQDDGLEEAALDLESFQDIIDDEPEVIRSPKSLMKHALMQSGSRDTSAQLFTALCRGLGIPARLVVSIQSVPWKAGIDGPKTPSKLVLKGREVVDMDYQSSDAGSSTIDPSAAVTPMSEKARGKQKANPVRLRKTKHKRQDLRVQNNNFELPDPLTTPPVFWTEVFSRPDSKWFPIDPIRGIVNKQKAFDPTSLNTGPGGPRTKIENRMLYVLAFEEDGYARDVTRRYAKQYGARVAKLQGGSNAPSLGGGKGRLAWWERVVNFLHRPFRLHRDDLEDQELDAAQLTEGMPTTISGFKDHPLYVLERHLKQTETIYPPPPLTAELGKFRAEPVYPRSAIVSLKTAENWLRSSGRVIREGEQPMKTVKVRPNTINKMRELEVLKDDLKVAGRDSPVGEGTSTAVATGEAMQGLYAFSQTETYVPGPVIDGVVPKNNFGNIDLYVPSMLPQGGVHIPFKGVAKVAKKLGFDYAEAVTGFEFRKKRAFPIIEGVVVAAETEAVLLEAFWETEKEAEEKARAKQRERVLKHWIRLVHGLRIRQKLQAQYGSKTTDGNELKMNKNTQAEDREGHAQVVQDDLDDMAGGFLAGADRVVTTFHLPKKTIMSSPPRPLIGRFESTLQNEKDDDSDAREVLELNPYNLDENSMDTDPPGASPLYEDVPQRDFVPKTMQQMAEDAAEREKGQKDENRRHGATGQTRTDAILQEASGSISTSTAKSIGRVTRLRSGAIKSETIWNPGREASKRPRGGRSSFTRRKRTSTNRTRRKRRRGDSESEDDAEASHDDVGEERDIGDDEESDEADLSNEDEEEDELHGVRTLSSKRPRNGRTNSFTNTKRSAGKAKASKASAALAISSPTMTTGDSGASRRTLRPRTSKATAQIE